VGDWLEIDHVDSAQHEAAADAAMGSADATKEISNRNRERPVEEYQPD
jgi:hypothetical protein